MKVTLLMSWLYLQSVCASESLFPVTQRLSYSTWKVHNANKSVSSAATVPGGIYSDLRSAGVLSGEIFYRFNDEEYRWVARDDWTYTTGFDVKPDVLKKDNIFLVFEGIDTVSSVYLNKHLLGKTNNMFVTYQFDVKHALKVSNNTLEVQIKSPISAAQRAAARSLYPVPPICTPPEYHGECHVNYLRKMQASFAWDWGPAFPSVGIWKNVSLRAYNFAYARHITVETRSEALNWKVSVTLYLDISSNITGMLSASLILDDKHKITTERQVTVSPSYLNPSLVFSVPKESIQLWWPNGYGSQPLYTLTVGLVSGQEATYKSISIGFRTITLVQEHADSKHPDKGLTFYFQVNGEPIFAKGSNYIPLHILPELSSEPSRLRHILTSARDANMNMIRVWGGGLYESDLFYQMCDELGIMIWQDLMFACSMYPVNPEFLASVVLEVAQQVERLQHHACIALWAGNNENEAALIGNWYGTQDNFERYKADYIQLYVNTVRPVIELLDKTRTYVVSSPSNGLESETEGYVANNPYDNKYGDVHWYNYVFNLWNSVAFPKPRFASEYGTMSLPSIESFANITIPSDLSLTSIFMNRRQHHLGGYGEMISEIQKNLYLPSDADLETFTYLSQINQAMSMKSETESYRRGRSYLDSIGEGLTMGALYWQLNDVWQAPSWSSIEFNGKWKMLHYFAVDFFAPIFVSLSCDVTRQLRAHVISDLRTQSSLDLVVQLTVYNWRSLTPVLVQQYPFTMAGAGVVKVASWNEARLLRSIEGCRSPDEPEKNCLFHATLLSNNASTQYGPENFYFPVPLRSTSGPSTPNVKVLHVTSLENGHKLTAILTTNIVAAFVWLNCEGIPGHFSQNGFLMVTNETQVTFTPRQPINDTSFIKCLKVKALQYHK